jgi:hypothetical protein
MMDKLLPFDIDVVSRCLQLSKEGMTMSRVVQFKNEDIAHVFEPNTKTIAGYLLTKTKGIDKEWLSYINYRILLPLSTDDISKEGVAAALMA